MPETLYRKYRPLRFADVSEQAHIVQTLQHQIAGNTVAHAYLFSGPRGVGKTTIARLLARALNCTGRKKGESEPCNTCTACTAFLEGRYMDAIEMDAASNTGVDNVRDNVIENVRFVPQQGTYKVFIIDEVHMLSGAAFNALLKTLEEPPAHAVFILATTELHKIPATIVSRCQRFDFHRIPTKEMVARLGRIATSEGVTVNDAVLHSIARLSEGCLRDAESLLGQVLAVGTAHITAEQVSGILPATTITDCVTLVAALTAGNLPAALATLEQFVAAGGAVRQLQDDLTLYVRAMLFATLGSVDRMTYDEKTTEALTQAAAQCTPDAARRLLDLVLTARTRPTLPLLPHLPLEIAFVEFCAASTPVAPVKNIVPTPAPRIAPPVKEPAAPIVLEKTTGASSEEHTPHAAVSDLPLHFTLEDVVNKWERCCAYIAARNVALPLILADARPVSLNDGVLTLAFGYGFHADAMREQKNIRLVEDAIADVLMGRPRLAIVVQPAVSDDPAVTLAAAFGGAVV